MIPADTSAWVEYDRATGGAGQTTECPSSSLMMAHLQLPSW